MRANACYFLPNSQVKELPVQVFSSESTKVCQLARPEDVLIAERSEPKMPCLMPRSSR